MNDLISRNGLLQKTETVPVDCLGEQTIIYASDVESAPAVDAVPVVRCKDCKHFRQISQRRGACEFFGSRITKIWMDVDDYCSSGAKKGDGQVAEIQCTEP